MWYLLAKQSVFTKWQFLYSCFYFFEEKKKMLFVKINSMPFLSIQSRYKFFHRTQCSKFTIYIRIISSCLLLPVASEFMVKTFQAAQLTHEIFLTIDHSCKIFFLISAKLNFHQPWECSAIIFKLKLLPRLSLFGGFDYMVSISLKNWSFDVFCGLCIFAYLRVQTSGRFLYDLFIMNLQIYGQKAPNTF